MTHVTNHTRLGDLDQDSASNIYKFDKDIIVVYYISLYPTRTIIPDYVIVMTRHAGIKLTDLELRITNRFLYVPNQHLFNFFTNHMFPKRIIKFLKLTQLRRKKQPKRDLLSSLLSLLIELVFFIELALQHHFNHKKGISSVSILLLLF